MQNCWRDEKTGEYKLVLDPTIIRLFQADDWTGLQMQERLALKGKPLAAWLHGFYSSHAKPFPLKVETLHALSGSANKDMRDFKRRPFSAVWSMLTLGVANLRPLRRFDRTEFELAFDHEVAGRMQRAELDIVFAPAAIRLMIVGITALADWRGP